MMTVNIDDKRATFHDGQAFIPIDELVDYIIDQLFAEPDKRHELHFQLPEHSRGTQSAISLVPTQPLNQTGSPPAGAVS